jgi:anti-sigma regulatory factor (Ser/Thr protein kinase)
MPAGSPRAARLLVRGEIERTGWRGDGDVAALLTSEIVCNALQHGGGRCDLTVSIDHGCLRVAAIDESSKQPVLRVPEPGEASGRGLFLLDRLATAWGVDPVGNGKAVWFDLIDDVPPHHSA